MLSVISGPFFHHLDHLAILSYFMECPLLVEDIDVFDVGKKYYPEVDIRHGNLDIFAIEDNSILFLSTTNGPTQVKEMVEMCTGRKVTYCFCPHGQSDKGLYNKKFRSTCDKEYVLSYGERQEAIITSPTIRVGNYRLLYHQLMGGSTTQKEINVGGKIIICAPTWDDGEHPSMFLTELKKLTESIPDGYSLILLVHPLLEKFHPSVIYSLQDSPNLQILTRTPTIYPLLEISDIYLGDYSSIGYDFLYFNKPMFFLCKERVPLHECGMVVSSTEELWQHIGEDQEEMKDLRRARYKHAFDEAKDIKKSLEQLLFPR